MNGINLPALISYVIVTTFTPGPNNISSAALAANYGLRRTLNYLFGIMSGFFLLMMLCGNLSNVFLRAVPAIEPYMRWVGACYILWLAWGILRSGHSVDDGGETDSRGFLKGLLLQFVNVKVIIYGLSLYTVFLDPILSHPLLVAASALSFALLSLTSVLTWSFFGVAIKRFLDSPGKRTAVNCVLALMLVYTALTVAGLL